MNELLLLITALAVANPTQEEYFKQLGKYRKEKRHGDPLVVLIWWAGHGALLERMPNECGGCWLTHEKHLEKEAAGIIFDQTRYRVAKKFNYGGGLPDFKRRNTEHQYWVWWPREAASKGYGWGMDWNTVGKSGWDSAFNLTASYRRDSDITRTWGTTQKLVNTVRVNTKTKQVIPFQEHI